MSDIPVGSPPVPPGRHAAPGGWYPDPVDPRQERYWDGWQWSRNTRPRELPPQQTGFSAPYRPGGASWPTQQPGQPGQSSQSWPPQPGQPGQPGQQWPPQSGQSGGYPQPYPGAPTAYGGRPGPIGPTTADGVPLAGWWWRVLSSVLDSLIVGVVTAIIGSPIYLQLFQRMSAFFADLAAAAERGETMPAPDTSAFISAGDLLLLTVIGLVVQAVYIVVFLRAKAATPGQLICGLRVVPVDHGHAAGGLAWRAAAVRAAVFLAPGTLGNVLSAWSATGGAVGAATSLLSLVLSGVYVLNVLWPLWHPKRQAWHDIAAGTQVVKIS